MRVRHKMYTIKEIVAEKKEWCEQYNDFPFDYWKRRWDFLCRRLNNYTDMERQMKHNRQKYYPPKETKNENVQTTSNGRLSN